MKNYLGFRLEKCQQIHPSFQPKRSFGQGEVCVCGGARRCNTAMRCHKRAEQITYQNRAANGFY